MILLYCDTIISSVILGGKLFAFGLATYLTGLGSLGGSISEIVTVSCNLICYIAVATYRTSVSGVSCLGTSRNCYLGIVAMAERSNLIGYVAVTAYGTSVSGIATIQAIGCSYYSIIAVTERLGFIGNVAVFTYRTGVSGVSCLGAGRFGNYRVIAMTKRENFGLRLENISTDSTLLTFGKSGVGTGCIYTGNNNLLMHCAKVLVAYVTNVILVLVGMSCSRNNGLRNDNLITGATDHACGKSVFGTGRILTVECLFGMAERLNFFGIIVCRIVMASKGLHSLLFTSGSESNRTVVPCVCIRVNVTVFSSTYGAYSLIGTISNTSAASMIATNGANTVYVVVFGALLKHRNNNILYANFYEVVANLYIKLFTTIASVELYVAGSVECGSYSRMSL